MRKPNRPFKSWYFRTAPRPFPSTSTNILFLDVPESSDISFQGIRRIYRMGQTKILHVWVGTLDHFYDQIFQILSYSEILNYEKTEIKRFDKCQVLMF